MKLKLFLAASLVAVPVLGTAADEYPSAGDAVTTKYTVTKRVATIVGEPTPEKVEAALANAEVTADTVENKLPVEIRPSEYMLKKQAQRAKRKK